MRTEMGEPTDGQWEVPDPKYRLTLWKETSRQQWESKTILVHDAVNVDEVLSYARADSWATRFELHAIVDRLGLIRLYGDDPVSGTRLSFNVRPAEE